MDHLLPLISANNDSNHVPPKVVRTLIAMMALGIAAALVTSTLNASRTNRQYFAHPTPVSTAATPLVMARYANGPLAIPHGRFQPSGQSQLQAIARDTLYDQEDAATPKASTPWLPFVTAVSALTAAAGAAMYALRSAVGQASEPAPNATIALVEDKTMEMPMAPLVGPLIQWLRASAVDTSSDPEKYAITPQRPLKVVIAGGGVGGLAAARYMQLKGIDVTILEKTSAFKRFGGPIQLASNALSTVKAIDENLFNKIMGKFTFTGTRMNGIIDGKRDTWFCEFWPISAVADAFDLPYTGVINRPDLQELFLEELRNHNPECVQNGAAVVGYENKPNHEGVIVKLDDGRTVEADVLVGADGIWSNIRAQMYNEKAKGLGSGTVYSGYTVFAGETVLKTDDYFEVGYKVYIGPNQYFVTSDVGEGRIQWYAFLGLPPDSKVPPAERRAFLSKLFEGWSNTIQVALAATGDADIEQRDLYDRRPEMSRSWSDGEVTMLGDAIHPMMPNLGQGGGQAIEDAFVLTNILAEATDRREIPRLLQEYYWKRIGRVSIIQGLSRFASDQIIATFSTPWYPTDNVQPFGYKAVLTACWRPILPIIFLFQFGYLYSYRPTTMEGSMPALVQELAERHRKQAEAAWERKAEGGEFVRPAQFS